MPAAHAIPDRFAGIPPLVERRVLAGERVLVVLLDAFGMRFVERHAGHALIRALDAVHPVTSQFPSTTTAHVTTMHTGLPVERVREWTLGCLARFVSYDEDTEEVLVHRLARHQVGEDIDPKDKRLIAINRLLASAHSLPLVRHFAALYPDWPVSIPEAPSTAGRDIPTHRVRRRRPARSFAEISTQC